MTFNPIHDAGRIDSSRLDLGAASSGRSRFAKSGWVVGGLSLLVCGSALAAKISSSSPSATDSVKATDSAKAARKVNKLLAATDGAASPGAAKPVGASPKPAGPAKERESATATAATANVSAEKPKNYGAGDSSEAPTALGAIQKAAPRPVTNETLPLAGDEIFLRRAKLDLLGEQPSPEEITAFVLDPSSTKRAKLVDRLLAQPTFGQNWGRYWRDVILYRRSDDRALSMTGTLVNYLSDQLNRNVPWDEVARSFITATGEIRENGETGVIMAQLASPEDTTAEMSRIFLGIQIQCAQCHNHPTDRWKREQFHEMAAFFTRIAVRSVRLDNQKRTFRIAGDDKGAGKRSPGSADTVKLEHYMPNLQDPQDKGTLMRPAFFVTGQKFELGASDADRRETLARWITAPSDRYFAEAFVNRMWSELVGHGFIEPVDDMGPDRPAQSPETLKYLADQFIANRYDVKWLFRTIMATDAYQRESRSRTDIMDPLANSCPQRLRADQLANLLLDALGVDESTFMKDAIRKDGKKDSKKGEKNANSAGDDEKKAVATAEGEKKVDATAEGDKKAGMTSEGGKKPNAAGQGGKKKGQLVAGPRGQLLQSFGYDPSARRDEVASAIPQALWLMNGGLVSIGTNGGPTTALGKLLASETNDEAVAVELYLRCLAREPKPAELQVCLDHVAKVGRNEGFEDVLWSLLNSTELLYRK